MVNYYDAILVAIAAVVIGGAALSIHPAIATYQGLAAGGMVATGLLFDVLFRNPPVEPSRTKMTGSVIVGVCWLLVLILYI